MVMRRIRTGVVAGLVAAFAAAPLLLSERTAHATADGCSPGVQSDFNGDGYSDAVVADPYATVAGHIGAGRVIVLTATTTGGSARAPAVWSLKVRVLSVARPRPATGSGPRWPWPT